MFTRYIGGPIQVVPKIPIRHSPIANSIAEYHGMSASCWRETGDSRYWNSVEAVLEFRFELLPGDIVGIRDFRDADYAASIARTVGGKYDFEALPHEKRRYLLQEMRETVHWQKYEWIAATRKMRLVDSGDFTVRRIEYWELIPGISGPIDDYHWVVIPCETACAFRIRRFARAMIIRDLEGNAPVYPYRWGPFSAVGDEDTHRFLRRSVTGKAPGGPVQAEGGKFPPPEGGGFAYRTVPEYGVSLYEYSYELDHCPCVAPEIGRHRRTPF